MNEEANLKDLKEQAQVNARTLKEETEADYERRRQFEQLYIDQDEKKTSDFLTELQEKELNHVRRAYRS